MLWTILFGGILLRLIPYLFNRSLWLDESMLALNIINKTHAKRRRYINIRNTSKVHTTVVTKAKDGGHTLEQ